MVVVPLIWPFGLRIRRVHILSPAVLPTILVIGGILLLLFTLQSMRKAKALIAQGGTIKVEGNSVTYPSIEKGKVEYRSFLISDIEYIKDDEEVHIPADTRSAFPVISVQSPVSIQCCWQS